jgi:hypothetical protein
MKTYSFSDLIHRRMTGEESFYDCAEVDQLIERYAEALQRIVQWADAYPLDVFPEPDFKKIHEALKAAGLSLDQVSASNMRHVVKGVGEIARAALT